MSSLYYVVIGGGGEGGRKSAPLEHVSVTGVLHDTVAEYVLEQRYVNPRSDVAIEAVYTFPLYEGVAVSGFEAEVDGRKIVGRVEEKAAARKEYDEAVKAGKVASLLAQERPDVFQASIGNIPPEKKICIRITLVSETKQDADENQVRLVLPTTIAPRYGANPVASASDAKSSASTLSVTMACAMSKPITSIQSPSHTIEVRLGSSEASASSVTTFEPNRARVSLTADSLLEKDFVLVVQAQGLDAPRAVVERHPRDGTHAVSLTFAPRFALQPLRSSELIFLVDRSGSMGGSQIKQAGEALELFLRSIPFEDHCFNVIGFGSSHQALFPGASAPYNEESLATSTAYARKLRANMGGTEMTSAFQEALHRRRRDIPTQIFLLTDGQIWNIDTLVQVIKSAVAETTTPSSFVRVFSLGVGPSVSHHLIESVARAGGGYAQHVVTGERMEKKVVNMLKSALMPPITNLAVQWAPIDDIDDFEMVEAVGESKPSPENSNKPTINLFDTEAASPPPPPTPLPEIVIPIQQAPFKVPALYRGARFTIYAILSATTPVPTELLLRGESPDGPVELKVSVEAVQEGETMLHALAARALVRDLEDGASCIHALGRATTEATLTTLGVRVLTQDGRKYQALPLSSNLVFELTKRTILDLALKYNLSSKYTSWVAVDTQSQQTIVHDEVKGVNAPGDTHLLGAGRMRQQAGFGSATPMFGMFLAPQAGASPGGFPWNAPAGGAPKIKARRRVRQTESATPSASAGLMFKAKRLSSPQEGDVDDLLDGLPYECMRFFSPQEGDDDDGGSMVPSSDPHARLRSLLQHQRFDGSFALTGEVAALLSTSVEEVQGKLGELQTALRSGVQLSEAEWETVWATCLAVEFMRLQLPELQEEWELVVEKAEKRVATLVKSPQDVAALHQAASEFLKVVFKGK
jgi:hypothetical protein